MTKLRAALPPDVVGELDGLRRHVAVVEPVREYEAPLLGELLRAAVDGAHLKVTYDSIRSGTCERVIFPFGVYASPELIRAMRERALEVARLYD